MKSSVPGKTFLLGEYLALSGGPSLIFTSEPNFEIEISKEGDSELHPESPAAVFLKKNGMENIGFRMADPYHGKGGFGRSTAEFLAAYQYVHGTDFKLETLIHTYKSCASGKPSGADLAAQATGGITLYDGYNYVAKQQPWLFKTRTLLVFHTGRKVPTHEHLKGLGDIDLTSLKPIMFTGLTCFTSGDGLGFGGAINAFYDTLAILGLADLDIKEKVDVIRGYSGVVGCKGCGALGVDTVAVVCALNEKDIIIRKIEKNFGFEYITGREGE